MTNVSNVAKRVLIVEDEAEISEILAGYLRNESFEPAVAATVASALGEIEHRPPDLILLDIGLPDGSGLDVLRKANEAAAFRRSS